MSTRDFVRGSVIRGIQMPSLGDFQYIFVCRKLRIMTAVDIIKESPRCQLTFIVSEIFTLAMRGVLAFLASPAAHLFRVFLSGHPQGEIGHDEGKLTHGKNPMCMRGTSSQGRVHRKSRAWALLH
jgi:hypothetical protein